MSTNVSNSIHLLSFAGGEPAKIERSCGFTTENVTVRLGGTVVHLSLTASEFTELAACAQEAAAGLAPKLEAVA